MFEFILDRYNYWIFIVLMMMGLYIVISRGNLVKKIIGLNVFQTSVFIFYISIGKIAGGTAPILIGGHDKGGHGESGHGAVDDHGSADTADDKGTNDLHAEDTHIVDAATNVAAYGEGAAHAAGEIIYTNPLPHVLILTAIVVGVATTAVGLALAVRIREAYGTIEEDELEADDMIAEFGDQAGEASA